MKALCLLALACVVGVNCFAQAPAPVKVYADTVVLDLNGAEKRFLEQNLELLIAKTDIDEAKGYLLQSKLFENPELDLNRQAWSFEDHKLLPKKPQYDVSVEQLFETAGKYVKEIQIAKQRVKLNEYEYYDVLRALKLDLRENYYELLADQQKAAVIGDGISGLQKMIAAVNDQVTKGFAARKELVRLQNLLIDYLDEQTEIQDHIIENEADLKQLLNYKGGEFIVAVADDASTLPGRIEGLTYDSLQTAAVANRYDLLAAKQEEAIGKNELTLEKMRVVPNFSMGAQYDRAGTGGEQYVGLLLNIPLPLLNHNEGNIKAAKAQYAQVQLERENKEVEVFNSVQEEYLQLLNRKNVYQTVNSGYNKQNDDIYKNIYDSYKDRTLGLIEFLEYFESYKDTKFNMIDIETDLKIQGQRLNFETGTDVIKP